MNRPDRRQSRPRLPETVPDALSRVEGLRRQVYFWALGLGSVILVATWVLQTRRPTPDPYVLYGHPVLLLQCLWAVVWLLQRRSLLVAERVVFIVNSVAVLAQLFLSLLTRDNQVLGLASGAYWMLVAVSILSYLMFSTRQALWLSAAFYGLGVVLPWAALVSRGEGLGAQPELARVQLTCGAILVLLYSLAWYRERFLVERGQRLTLEQLANTDPLTQLPNRRALYPVIERLLEEGGRGTVGCLILFDLDHFKRINDTHGHNAGDEVLIRGGGLIRAALRDTDHLGRWGGEEFLITLPGVSASQGQDIAERLRTRLAAHTFPGVGQVTASFGVAPCLPGDDLPRWTARADAALYRAKDEGRNRVVLQTDRSSPEEQQAPLVGTH
ncbi:GGDEF domain-containing protein (plasmid) [Deinococcus metallilatus]|uniref:Diguanylate cyclase (GGDEF)-like protein n=1 Tax=Deinococcus metallilatus TaxID=1211322 RepID=A0AAJ5F5E1_9DEIO|nr:GGDEF domain-containing protein [Deinococcus metallilatus]MBB5297281.1 diguanylate cyclase (GGDEF)-like protein [Deinococcus metallilatus]QBY06972.1 GGDEF domain-containing protein [Deinococcus metallilatus]TLK31919.1 GGDEF domain-containing protein [Deinococcus metallilatus]GMA17155.1 GGDEF domain-containing protein [Deinococcus metallilatus]